MLGWAHANLFSNRFNTALTAISVLAIGAALWFALRWLLVESDWTVISTLGGRLAIGPYNTEGACPGQDCFWRPQAALMLVTMLLGMGWVVAGGGLTKRIAIGVVVVLAAFSLLPYSLDKMGMDVRLLLLANIPALAFGWFLARYTPLGSAKWVAILAVGTFLVTLILLRGVEGVPGLQPVSVNHWGGLMLNLLLAVVGIALSFPIGVALALGRRNELTLSLGVVMSGIGMTLAVISTVLSLSIGGAAGAALTLAVIELIGVGIVLSLPFGIRMNLEGRSDLILPVGVALFFASMALPVLGMLFSLPFREALIAVGIPISLLIGTSLDLGHRIKVSMVKLLCVAFIEIFRGVPLITLLFMSQTLVPLAFPENFPVNSLMRAGIVITLFSAAYTAENIRGGLQALHRGQTEAAQSLGLQTWQTTLFITLPQAIRNVIPAIVGQFISLFKDTTLVFIIGMQDILTYSRAFIQGNPEFIPSAHELFIFLAIVFWIFCYTMSYVSRRIEHNLGVGRR